MNFLEKYEGKSLKTVDIVVSAIFTFQQFTNNKEFQNIKEKDIESFRNYLKQKTNKRTGDNISLSTQFDCLRHLKAFFTWLSQRPGYKSKITPDLPMLFRLTLNEEESLKGFNIRDCPPNLEYIDSLLSGIIGDKEIDKRDRAMISLIAMTGLRDSALSSLPIKALDLERKLLIQKYSDKVKVKFGKLIPTPLMIFKEDYLTNVKNWYDFLILKKKFGSSDPLFPKINIEQEGQYNLSFTVKEFKPLFMKDASPIRMMLKKRCESANLKYYPPHAFRHLITKTAMNKASNFTEAKAISQSLGHEHLATTIGTYSKLPTDLMIRTMEKIDFKSKKSGNIFD